MTGNYSAATAEDRGKLLQKAYEYFGEIKDKYACADDYMPYLEACEEYDPGIERAMRGELHGLIASDPDCIQWMTNIGAVYPPPQKIDSSMLTGNFKKFDDPLIGGWNKLAEFEQPQPANAPDTAAAWRDGLNNGCLKYSRGFAGSAFDGLYNGLKNSRYV